MVPIETSNIEALRRVQIVFGMRLNFNRNPFICFGFTRDADIDSDDFARVDVIWIEIVDFKRQVLPNF